MRWCQRALSASGSTRPCQGSIEWRSACIAGGLLVVADNTAEDPLAQALDEGRLHRNFQGYTTDDCPTLIGFGASSIGRLPQGYVQNAVLIGDYQRRVAAGDLAVSKACAFAREDRLRATVIERLMCDYRVDLREICGNFGADPEQLIRSAVGVDALVKDGLAERDHHVIAMRADARPLVRVLAAAFDQYLGQGPARHSRAV